MELTIDSEFKALIPPLSSYERDQLRDNVLADGIRDSLVTWRGILLDGHNRYEIATDYGLTFKTAEIELPDRDAALLWIINNQLGRRNLTPQQTMYLHGKRYEAEKRQDGGHGDQKSGYQNDTPIRDTAERIAQDVGVSAPTIKRAAAFARNVDAIADAAGDDAREAILSGEIKLTQEGVGVLADVAREEPEKARQFYATTTARQDVAVTVFSSESNEYYTPSPYIEAARRAMGSIDLDPASCAEAQGTIQAGRYFTAADDGLTQDWMGNVWVNPPYGKIGNDSSQGMWGEYLLRQYALGNVTQGILLVKAAVGYEWFERLWDRLPVCFARERISFIKPGGSNDGSSKQGTAFFYVGENVDSFIAEFKTFGRIILPNEQHR